MDSRSSSEYTAVSGAANASSVWNSGHAYGRSLLVKWPNEWLSGTIGDAASDTAWILDTTSPASTVSSAGIANSASAPTSLATIHSTTGSAGATMTSTGASLTVAPPILVTSSAGIATAPITTAAVVQPVQPQFAPAYSHIVVVMEENHDYSQVIGQGLGDPYIINLPKIGAIMRVHSG
jgi:hypothetical protein